MKTGSWGGTSVEFLCEHTCRHTPYAPKPCYDTVLTAAHSDENMFILAGEEERIWIANETLVDPLVELSEGKE